jgi:hypothetical protein
VQLFCGNGREQSRPFFSGCDFGANLPISVTIDCFAAEDMIMVRHCLIAESHANFAHIRRDWCKSEHFHEPNQTFWQGLRFQPTTRESHLQINLNLSEYNAPGRSRT